MKLFQIIVGRYYYNNLNSFGSQVHFNMESCHLWYICTSVGSLKHQLWIAGTEGALATTPWWWRQRIVFRRWVYQYLSYCFPVLSVISFSHFGLLKQKAHWQLPDVGGKKSSSVIESIYIPVVFYSGPFCFCHRFWTLEQLAHLQ